MDRTTLIKLLIPAAIFVISACGDRFGVELSPEPGIVRVVLQADARDTSIVILGSDWVVAAGDSLDLMVYQGKVWDIDANFATLYKCHDSWRQEEYYYNVLSRVDGEYESFVAFESFVPDGKYESISIGMRASLMLISPFRIPVELPPGVDAIMKLPIEFEVFEEELTEITVQISPFQSMKRYQDSYQFDRIVEVTGVTYYDKDEFLQAISVSHSDEEE